MHGYEIAQRIRERSAAALAPSEGSLYPALHRLEERGSLAAEWGPGEAGPRRRYYRLTEAGRGRLAEARAEFADYVADIRKVSGPLVTETRNG